MSFNIQLSLKNLPNKFAKFILIAATLSSPYLRAEEAEACVKPWIFFDLGNTIVDTKTNNYQPMYYMRDVSAKNEDESLLWQDGKTYTTAQDYVNALNNAAYTLGMLIDVPEEWGVNYPEAQPILDYPSAKIYRLFDFLAGKVPADNTSWKEGEPAFDYAPFGEWKGEGANRLFSGRLILPQKNTERKSKGSLVVFQRAVAAAKVTGCRAVYQGEDTEEMKLAEEAGMIPFQVGTTSKTYFYIPIDKLEHYVESYRPGMWMGLGENDFL